MHRPRHEPLRLPPPISEAVLAHAEWCLPDEACGLIAVDGSGRPTMAYPLTNAVAAPNRFTIEPTEHYGALVHAESHGWDIGGVFHSHPTGPAVPSDYDLAQAHDPDWFHLIVGFAPGVHVRAWRMVDGEAIELC